MILDVTPLRFPFETLDPFLATMHHVDNYPAGDDGMAPKATLEGRAIGNDFGGKDGWSMYHGDVVPGFPQHPHRGFETVTIVRRGFIDHSDSLGAAARFGAGDVQWITAGKGICHSEMFPLLDTGAKNPTELFQIWLNLPHKDKLTDPYFTMLWHPSIPRVTEGNSEVTVIAGDFKGAKPPPPPPKSWAADPENDVAIWTIRLKGKLTLPKAQSTSNRALYFFGGRELVVGGEKIPARSRVVLEPDAEIVLESDDADLLLLQGRPINEPVAQYGPFVMTTRAEIQQAVADYSRTKFGGWPWPNNAPVHPRERGHWARWPDGHEERA